MGVGGARDSGHFLIVHHRSTYCGFNDEVLAWVAANIPEARSRFVCRALPCALPDADDTRLLIPWLQDPVEAWSRRTYDQALALGEACRRRGIATINPVDRLGHARKSTAAALMRGAGLRVPTMARVADADAFRRDQLGVPLPLFVREDVGHRGEMLRADVLADLRALPLGRFASPVAIEVVDLPDPEDGLYRKYRYVVCGDRGVPHHLQVSTHWVTRGARRVVNARTRADELAYIGSPSPHHDAFQRARTALGLDVVAFDYGIDRQGTPVVWEANPYPFLQFSRRSLTYRNEAMHRTMAILVALYFERAGLPVPARLAEYLAACPPVSPAGAPAPAAGGQISWVVPRARTRMARARLMLAKTFRRLRPTKTS